MGKVWSLGCPPLLTSGPEGCKVSGFRVPGLGECGRQVIACVVLTLGCRS